MPLQMFLYNSLSKQMEPFSPRAGKTVGLYNCGPTVYRRSHIGNMRRYLFADFLRRSLELMGYTVREITNITDVGHLTQDDIEAGEDKLEQEARAQKKTPAEIAHQQIELFQADLTALNIQAAQVYPRATEHIPEMITLIEQLITRGHAYQTVSGIYYDVRSFPEYGKLSGNTLPALAAGARVAVREDKRHPADFALWKLNDPEHLQQWDSPWGRGYPGWHIECSAMSEAYLGHPIDIHTGGEDNRFPHHENEIAQSEGAHDGPFVRFWLHNRHVRMGSEKLAKRDGTAITLDTLREQGFSPLAFRLLVFGSHYRSLLEFSWESLAAASTNLDTIRQLVRLLLERKAPLSEGTPDGDMLERFKAALANDLNTPEALAVVMDFVHIANQTLETSAADSWATLQALDAVLGLIAPLRHGIEQETIPQEISDLLTAREAARTAGNFSEADRLRDEIGARGFIIEDTPHGARLKKRNN